MYKRQDPIGFIAYGIHSRLLGFYLYIDVDEVFQEVKVVDVQVIEFLFQQCFDVDIGDERNIVISCCWKRAGPDSYGRDERENGETSSQVPKNLLQSSDLVN